jgi:hypothetical protein
VGHCNKEVRRNSILTGETYSDGSSYRRGQDRFKREYLTPKRPPPSPYEGWEKGKKSVASIQETLQEATYTLVCPTIVVRGRLSN